MRILTGLLISIAGFLLIVYRERVKGMTGDIGFAEQYLGGGGTYTFYLLLGIVLFFVGLMWASGTLQSWFIENLGLYFGHPA
ncbi:MAG: hypothetical protein UW70_C0016G0011 [Candidatus Peregrinibacteria bacterium GW2011_GWA2_44_7]|nr:MAG: hypothetical protein UW70_C0016G0011 [Candidatus Peregrinibacteria bacterium GW2011_GWA2_44_7]